MSTNEFEVWFGFQTSVSPDPQDSTAGAARAGLQRLWSKLQSFGTAANCLQPMNTYEYCILNEVSIRYRFCIYSFTSHKPDPGFSWFLRSRLRRIGIGFSGIRARLHRTGANGGIVSSVISVFSWPYPKDPKRTCNIHSHSINTSDLPEGHQLWNYGFPWSSNCVGETSMCLQLPSSLQSFIIIYVGFSKKQKSLQVFPDRNRTGASRTKSSSCCRELKDRQRPSPLTAARTMSGSWRQRCSKPRVSCQGLHLLVLVHAGPCWSMLVHAGPCWSLTSPTNQLLKKNGEKQNFFVSTCFYLYVDMQHSAHDFQLLSPGCSAFPTILVVLTNTCPAQEVSAASGSIRRAIGLARIISSAKLSSCSRSSATWEMHRDDIRKVGWRWLEQVCKSWNSGSGTVNAKRGHGEYRCVCVCPLLHKRFQQNVWICVNACVNARKNHCSPA